MSLQPFLTFLASSLVVYAYRNASISSALSRSTPLTPLLLPPPPSPAPSRTSSSASASISAASSSSLSSSADPSTRSITSSHTSSSSTPTSSSFSSTQRETSSSSSILSTTTIFSFRSQSQPLPTFAALSESTTSLGSSTSDSPTFSVSPTPSTTNRASVNLSPTGFWKNKGSVAATFTLIGLLIFGLVGGAAYVLARQRRREKQLKVEEFFDKHDSAEFARGASPGPSMTQITTPASTEAYVSRDVHFGQTYMHYGLDYPPGTAYSTDEQRFATSASYGGQYDHQGTDLPPHPHPVVNEPPVSYRQPRGRGSATYQPSIDSFYGGIDACL